MTIISRTQLRCKTRITCAVLHWNMVRLN